MAQKYLVKTNDIDMEFNSFQIERVIDYVSEKRCEVVCKFINNKGSHTILFDEFAYNNTWEDEDIMNAINEKWKQ